MEHDAINRLEGGLRTRGGGARFNSQKPLVTVITIVMNDHDYLEETIRSVLGQTYENVEYILIDGGSTDGTLDIVKKYDERIDYWLSEPDKGIYDAMNKGAGLASGEWINFMNAGDRFYGNSVVNRIFALDRSHCDIIYGNHEVSYGGRFSRIGKAGSVEELWKGMNFSHQSAFIRTSLVRMKGFNVGNAIGADFEMIYSLKQEGNNFSHVDETVATVKAGGLSDIERVNSIMSHWKVVSVHESSAKVTFYYFGLIADSAVRSAVKRILPQGFIDWIIKLKQ